MRYGYGVSRIVDFFRMNFVKGTVVQIPIRYNKDKNKRGDFLSTAARYLDLRVHRDVPMFLLL